MIKIKKHELTVLKEALNAGIELRQKASKELLEYKTCLLYTSPSPRD